MGSFDDNLSNWEAAAPSDIVVEVPDILRRPRRLPPPVLSLPPAQPPVYQGAGEQSVETAEASTDTAVRQAETREREEQREVHEHSLEPVGYEVREEQNGALSGQGGGGGNAAAGHPGDAAGSVVATPEPVPQLEELVDEDAEAPEPEEEEAVPATSPSTAVAENPEDDEEDVSGTEAHPVRRGVVSPGSLREPAVFVKTGFSYGDGTGGGSQVRIFPKELNDKLRDDLTQWLGEDFSSQLSLPALITAFTVARLGITVELDVNTELATQAFREMEPKLSVVEDRTADIQADIVRMAAVMEGMHKKMTAINTSTDAIEFSQAYLIADRISLLPTQGVTEDTVDVTQPRVVRAKDRIRTSVKSHQTVEKHREGRRR